MTYLQDVRGKYFASLVFQWQSILPAIDAGTKDKNNNALLMDVFHVKTTAPGWTWTWAEFSEEKRGNSDVEMTIGHEEARN